MIRLESQSLAREELSDALYSSRGGGLSTRGSGSDSIIHVTLGPSHVPERVSFWRSKWPTVTALNFAEGREFHMRLRQNRSTGIYLVYGSLTLPNKEVRQRGRFCRSLRGVEQAIVILRQELELSPSKRIGP